MGPSDPSTNDADQRMLDALLSIAGESDGQRVQRIGRVLDALDNQHETAARAAVIGRIRPTRWLGPAGLAAAILLAMWVIWPRQGETAQAAMGRVAEALQSVEFRRYDATLYTSDDKRVSVMLDIAKDGRFVSQIQGTGPLGLPLEIIGGSNGRRYWQVPPVGPVVVSDRPIGPMLGIHQADAKLDREILTVQRIVAQLQDSYDIQFASSDDPELMRLAAKPIDKTSSGPGPASAEIIARRDSGEFVQLNFTLNEPFHFGKLRIHSASFTLRPDAEEPNAEWYEHETHHRGRPVLEK